MQKRILIVLGTRPEAVKMAPLRTALQRESRFEVRVCSTGQHEELLRPMLEFFGIVPDFSLDVMRSAKGLHDVASAVITGMTRVLTDWRPDLLLVQGDTTTTLTGALAAFYQRVPIGHVEAGLRTYNLEAPWPEEMNRQATTRMSTYHFAPTRLARRCLLREGVADARIAVTGNTVVDALMWTTHRIDGDAALRLCITSQVAAQGYDLERPRGGRRMILVTGHRRENLGQGFDEICRSIRELSVRHPDVDIVYPVHLNPGVRTQVFGGLSDLPNVFLIEPVQYPHFVALMRESTLILTDSGGVQEEAPSLGKPVLVMRETTERMEGVRAGTVRLVGSDFTKIVSGVEELLTNHRRYERMSRAENPYGDGRASERIGRFLVRQLIDRE